MKDCRIEKLPNCRINKKFFKRGVRL